MDITGQAAGILASYGLDVSGMKAEVTVRFTGSKLVFTVPGIVVEDGQIVSHGSPSFDTRDS